MLRTCQHLVSLFVVALAFLLPAAVAQDGPPLGPLFIRGDVDQDGQVALDDPLGILNHLFIPPMNPLPCADAADANADGTISIPDPLTILSFLFIPGSPPIAKPYPYCGVDYFDFGLRCDDPNPTCIPPTLSFVVNSPSRIGAGNDSILRIETSFGGQNDVAGILGPNPAYNGIRHLDGLFSDLFAVQLDAPAGINRIVYFDGYSGRLYDHFDGYQGEIHGLSVTDFARIQIVKTQSTPPTTQLLEINPFDNWQTNVIWEESTVYTIHGSTADHDQDAYFTGTNGNQSGVFKVGRDGDLSLIVEVTDPGPIQFDFLYNVLWVVTAPSGQTVRLTAYGLDGFFSESFEIPGYVDAVVGDFGVTNERMYIPLPEENKILIYDYSLHVVEDILDSSHGVEHPVDIAAPEHLPLP